MVLLILAPDQSGCQRAVRPVLDWRIGSLALAGDAGANWPLRNGEAVRQIAPKRQRE